jgi:hypothetical protein
VQFFLAYAAYSAAIVGVLHGLNALAIFAVALLAGRRVPKAAPVAEPSAAEEAPVLRSGPTLGPPISRVPPCVLPLAGLPRLPAVAANCLHVEPESPAITHWLFDALAPRTR